MILLGGGPAAPTSDEIGNYNRKTSTRTRYEFGLTPKQLSRLTLYASGFTLEQIAKAEGRHHSSIGESLHRAAANLRVVGIRQAARKARAYELIKCRLI
jgi:DNA-binding CsgD family transcriptional regulator